MSVEEHKGGAESACRQLFPTELQLHIPVSSLYSTSNFGGQCDDVRVGLEVRQCALSALFT